MITLALPSKGAISEPTLSFLRECGLRVEKPNQRQYTGYIPALAGVNVLFQRVNDVVYKVIDGTAQLGITGYDVVRENSHSGMIVIHDHLGYGQCSLVVAVPESWIDVSNMMDLVDVALDFREFQHRNIRIATKYPVLSREFLHQHGIHHFTLVKAEGAIEAAPLIGYADLIIDLTQTGTTLRENHLKILSDGVIVESQACLIGHRNAFKDDVKALNTLRQLLEFIDATHNGRRYSQITANIIGDTAREVAEKVSQYPATCGLQGPSISPMFNSSANSNQNTPGWFTVNVVVANENLLAAVEYLRDIGGTQTIVSPVRYVFQHEGETYLRLLQHL